MPPRQIPSGLGHEVLARYRENPASVTANVDTFALACRYTLQELARRAPGRSVEVRVPPFGAVQIIGGPTHTRGTPPAVVEMGPEVWLALALGRLSLDDALANGDIDSSGHRANLQEWLPLTGLV